MPNPLSVGCVRLGKKKSLIHIERDTALTAREAQPVHRFQGVHEAGCTRNSIRGAQLWRITAHSRSREKHVGRWKVCGLKD